MKFQLISEVVKLKFPTGFYLNEEIFLLLLMGFLCNVCVMYSLFSKFFVVSRVLLNKIIAPFSKVWKI